LLIRKANITLIKNFSLLQTFDYKKESHAWANVRFWKIQFGIGKLAAIEI